MAGGFAVYNLARGTEGWTPWFSPTVGLWNARWSPFWGTEEGIALDLEEGAIVSVSMELETQGLHFDQSATSTRWPSDHPGFLIQGEVDKAWVIGNVVTKGSANRFYQTSVPDGTMRLRWTDTVTAKNSGSHVYGFELRFDACAGGKIRARRLMVVTRQEPRAWAPAVGEEISGG